MDPDFDSRSLQFCEKKKKNSGLPDKTLHFCRCASFPIKLSGKNPTIFVEYRYTGQSRG